MPSVCILAEFDYSKLRLKNVENSMKIKRRNNEMNKTNQRHDTKFRTHKRMRNEPYNDKPFRKWVRTPFGQRFQYRRGNHSFLFMSFNILAQSLIESHEYLYRNHNKNFLNWSHRLHCLQAEICASQPKILCLQEVQESHLSDLQKALQTLNYSAEPLYKKRTGANQDDGCAIFYDRNSFELIDHRYVEYFSPQIKQLNRFNVGIIAKFASKKLAGSEFILANTHLVYNPNRDDVRIAQLQVLLTEISKFANNSRTNAPLPVILSGDFNSQSFSLPWKLICNGNISVPNALSSLGISDQCTQQSCEYAGIAQSEAVKEECDLDAAKLGQSQGIKLFDTGKIGHSLSFVPTMFGNGMASTLHNDWILVDYIFYTKFTRRDHTKMSTHSNLQLLSNYELPSKEQCRQFGPIPNQFIGSDHYSLLSEFVLLH